MSSRHRLPHSSPPPGRRVSKGSHRATDCSGRRKTKDCGLPFVCTLSNMSSVKPALLLTRQTSHTRDVKSLRRRRAAFALPSNAALNTRNPTVSAARLRPPCCVQSPPASLPLAPRAPFLPPRSSLPTTPTLLLRHTLKTRKHRTSHLKGSVLNSMF